MDNAQPTYLLDDPIRKRGLNTSMAVMFLMNAGFFLIIPLVSVHYVDDLGWAAAFIGLVLAIRQFMQQGLTVFGGALADRFGPKGLIMAGVLIRSVSFVMMGFATTPATLLISGILAAVGGALFDAPQTAVVASLSRPEELPAYYARNGILGNIARTVGPLIGALLIHFDFEMVGIAAAAFFFLAFLVTWVGLPNVATCTVRQSLTSGLRLAAKDRTFVTYTLLMMGFWFMWVQISIALPLVVKAITGDTNTVALLFAVNSVLAIALQVPALRLAQKFFTPLAIVIIGVGLMAIGLGSVGWAKVMPQIYISVFFFALGTVLVMPNSYTVTASLANPAARGAYFGVSSLALALGGGFGHIVGGMLMDWATRFNQPTLPWLTFALIGTASLIGLIRFYTQQRERMTALQLAVSTAH
jgi:DHA1 family multidrug resistance protein-like MFS transporter